MAIKFDKITPGMELLDIPKTRWHGKTLL